MPTYGRDDLLTEQQLCDELGKSKDTLGRWRRLGIGPRWLRIGKTPRYRWSEVLEWLEEQAGQSPGPPSA